MQSTLGKDAIAAIYSGETKVLTASEIGLPNIDGITYSFISKDGEQAFELSFGELSFAIMLYAA